MYMLTESKNWTDNTCWMYNYEYNYMIVTNYDFEL